MGEADPRPLLRCLLNLYVPSSCCFLPGGREQTHILGFLACIDCMAEKRAHQCLRDRTLLCETCNGGCDVRGWCQYREEHGRWAVGGQLGLG